MVRFQLESVYTAEGPQWRMHINGVHGCGKIDIIGAGYDTTGETLKEIDKA